MNPRPKLNSLVIHNVPRQQHKEGVTTIIDKDLQSVLRPLNFTQNMFICAKYSIRDNVVTSNSPYYKCFSIICIFFYLGFEIFVTVAFLLYFPIPKFLSMLMRINYIHIVFLTGYAISISSNIIHSRNNVLLVLKIQNVLKSLDIKGENLKTLVVVTWVFVISLHVCCCLVRSSFFSGLSVADILCFLINYICVLFETNILYAVVILKLLRKMLNVWMEKFIKSTKESMRERRWNTMYKTYSNILEAYTLFVETFRLLVSLLILFLLDLKFYSN